MASFGIVDDDLVSTAMGQNGVDVVFSPAAKRVLDLCIEAKNVEALNVVGTFIKHNDLYAKKPGLKLLIHTRNRMQPLVTMLWSDLLELFSTHLNHKHICNQKPGG